MTRRWPIRWPRPGARRRRERAGIPDEVRHREKWRLALDMIQEMTGPGGWGVLDLVTAAGGARPVVAADIGYGDNALFRQQLTAAGWQYAVAVKGSTTAHDGGAVPQARPYGGLGQPPKPAYPRPPATLRQLALAHAAQVQPVTWRQGTKATQDNPAAAMTSCFLAIRVRPAGRPITREADRTLPACWLLAEWPPEADEPSGYWLSTLPQDTPLEELVRLAKIRWRVEHDYRELKTGLGWTTSRAARSPAGTATSPSPSWPRPSAPCSGLTQKRLRRDDPLPGPARTADRARPHPRRLPPLPQPPTLDRLAPALTPT